jgi:GMP synthase-like glutamine amidotransferase
MIAILKNTKEEGTGTIGDYLREVSADYRIFELAEGEAPQSLEDFRCLIILGGPMGVYEMDRYPHLKIASRLIREGINREMNILGICLGAQLLAHCLGADVYMGHEKEIGWFNIEITADGISDPHMQRLATHPDIGDFWKIFKVFHWHGDTFDLPMDAVRLASSSLYENQAFRYGKNVYAFQFHIEVTEEMVYEWLKDESSTELIFKDTKKFLNEYRGRAMNFYKSFFKGMS